MNRNDEDFDARLRDTWRTAADAVPPTVAWRLRPAVRETRTPSRWPLAAALAAAAVIALAIGLRPQTVNAPVATHAVATTTTATANATASSDDITAALDRNPDFYAWLASPDAEQLAME
jgi:hypothetical protein